MREGEKAVEHISMNFTVVSHQAFSMLPARLRETLRPDFSLEISGLQLHKSRPGPSLADEGILRPASSAREYPTPIFSSLLTRGENNGPLSRSNNSNLRLLPAAADLRPLPATADPVNGHRNLPYQLELPYHNSRPYFDFFDYFFR